MKSFGEEPRIETSDTDSGKNLARILTRRRMFAALAVAPLLAACSGGNNSTHAPSSETGVKNPADNQAVTKDVTETENPVEDGENLQNPEVLHRAEQIISTFENSTKEIQYDYAEELGDGRGITAGRSGFTSETGDLLQVVQVYADMGNEDSLLVTKYLHVLEAIDKGDEDAAENLEGFIEVWKETAKEQDLRDAQDAVYKELYLDPALTWADDVSVRTALGQTILLDTIIQHGEGDDVDGFPYIVQETVEEIGKADGQEVDWLNTFLNIREKHLMNAADPETREVWAESVDRVNALRYILESNNMSLTPPIEWTVYGDPFSITK